MSNKQNDIILENALEEVGEDNMRIFHEWFLKQWISYKEFLRLSHLPF